jgi:glycosyltransferase involved in cell wall biosynthesis
MTKLKLLQINVAANWGSHGRIAEEIGLEAMAQGWESYIAYGRYANPSKSHIVKIGDLFDHCLHGAQSLLLDRHGLASCGPTKKLIREIEQIKPDLIHLHNIHGFYLNYPILFRYLSTVDIPVVWTLHDCWAFTGHCAWPIHGHCDRFQEQCCHCPLQSKGYPKSFLLDRSRSNFKLKKRYFRSLQDLHLVTVSRWLEQQVRLSFMQDMDIRTIYNGLDTEVFRPSGTPPTSVTDGHPLVLGVCNAWYDWKGLDDMAALREILPDDYEVMVVGVNEDQMHRLPEGITCIRRTDSVSQLAEIYSQADVFVNPSKVESFGMTTAEALSCGTPSIVYDTSACPEVVDNLTGRVVPLGDVNALAKAVMEICSLPGREAMRQACRERAIRLFNRQDRYKEYLQLYNEVLQNHQSR